MTCTWTIYEIFSSFGMGDFSGFSFAFSLGRGVVSAQGYGMITCAFFCKLEDDDCLLSML
jgi:hypothetical protein